MPRSAATLMSEYGRKMTELSISMLGRALDLQQDPDKLIALEKLGIKEILLFMAGPNVDATLSDSDAGALALKIG